MALTDAAIKAAKPAAKLFRITDNNGLCLEIAPTDSKLWRYRYRFNDKAKMLALGTYPPIPAKSSPEARRSTRAASQRHKTPANKRKPLNWHRRS